MDTKFVVPLKGEVEKRSLSLSLSLSQRLLSSHHYLIAQSDLLSATDMLNSEILYSREKEKTNTFEHQHIANVDVKRLVVAKVSKIAVKSDVRQLFLTPF